MFVQQYLVKALVRVHWLDFHFTSMCAHVTFGAQNNPLIHTYFAVPARVQLLSQLRVVHVVVRNQYALRVVHKTVSRPASHAIIGGALASAANNIASSALAFAGQVVIIGTSSALCFQRTLAEITTGVASETFLMQSVILPVALSAVEWGERAVFARVIALHAIICNHNVVLLMLSMGLNFKQL